MEESIVEGGVDVANSKHGGVLSGLRSVGVNLGSLKVLWDAVKLGGITGKEIMKFSYWGPKCK